MEKLDFTAKALELTALIKNYQEIKWNIYLHRLKHPKEITKNSSVPQLYNWSNVLYMAEKDIFLAFDAKTLSQGKNALCI